MNANKSCGYALFYEANEDEAEWNKVKPNDRTAIPSDN